MPTPKDPKPPPEPDVPAGTFPKEPVSNGGRPCELTEGVVKEIVMGVNLGSSIELAANAAGISYATVRRWLAQGKKDEKADVESDFRSFRSAIQKAKGKRASRWLARIEEAAKESWQAAAWKLERTHPDLFGRVIQRLEHAGVPGKPLQLQQQTETFIALATPEALELHERLLDIAVGRATGSRPGLPGRSRGGGQRRPVDRLPPPQAPQPEAPGR